ncbi:hypothetical protein ACROYT_G021151 [Oculina patagonica]
MQTKVTKLVGNVNVQERKNTVSTCNPEAQNTIMDLRHNKIEVLPEGIFENLSSLVWLYLSHNKIEALPEGIFQNLPELWSLDLSVNKIEAPSGVIFQNLSSL